MSADPRRAVSAACDGLAALSLDAVLAIADLQTRADRKYVVRPSILGHLLDEFADDFGVLEIGGVRSFAYESVYFDTPGLACYFGAAHGRRRRFKVRTRTYLDSGLCVLEVKTRSGRGNTVKERIPYDSRNRYRLDDQALAFISAFVALADACSLKPVLTTSYWRTTLVHLHGGGRLTCDAGLVCSTPYGGSVSLPEQLLIETKSSGPATPADRFLWRAGARPVPISKYCIGMATLDPLLPANKWNRTLHRHFAEDDLLRLAEAHGNLTITSPGAQTDV